MTLLKNVFSMYLMEVHSFNNTFLKLLLFEYAWLFLYLFIFLSPFYVFFLVCALCVYELSVVLLFPYYCFYFLFIIDINFVSMSISVKQKKSSVYLKPRMDVFVCLMLEIVVLIYHQLQCLISVPLAML